MSIYANHAGTSWPKPEPVQRAAAAALREDALRWPESFEIAHRNIARHFSLDDPRRLLLTPGCTSALSLGVFDHPWSQAEGIAVSGFEHVAVERAAASLARWGVSMHVLPARGASLVDLEAAERLFRHGRIRLLAVTAAVNVTGDPLPIFELAALARKQGVRVLIDAAQAVGWMEPDRWLEAFDLIAFGGHKGLQGTWGIGGLLVGREVVLRSPRLDGDLERPGWCDGGSVDRSALAALSAAIDWLEAPAQQGRTGRARALVQRLESALRARSDVQVVASRPPAERMPAVAVTGSADTLRELSQRLQRAGITVGTGQHCAPLAHRSLGTGHPGAIRFSFGPSSAPSDVDGILEALGPGRLTAS